jgi:hypothetical protein
MSGVRAWASDFREDYGRVTVRDFLHEYVGTVQRRYCVLFGWRLW